MARSVVNVLSRAFFWTAGWVDGAIDAIASSLRSKPSPWRAALRRSTLPLQAAILGRHRRQIVEALGTPPAIGPGESVPRSFWQALTWYYPCDAMRREAIAIRFVNDRARRVEFIRVPG